MLKSIFSLFITALLLLTACGYEELAEQKSVSAFFDPVIIRDDLDESLATRADEDSYFIMIWQTTEENEVAVIPTDARYEYSYGVDWGDEATDDNSEFEWEFRADAKHIFAEPGVYMIRIEGLFPKIYFNNGPQRKNILSVEQWGQGEWRSMAGSFAGCQNLEINALDAPDLTLVRDMSAMFSGAVSVDFSMASWNIRQVSNMRDMLLGVQLSVRNYDESLIAWSYQLLRRHRRPFEFNAGSSQYCEASRAQRYLERYYNWRILDGGRKCVKKPRRIRY